MTAKSSNGTGLLTREQILGADDLKHDEVEVEEWGGRVRIRELTGGERQEFDAAIATVKHDMRRGGTNVEVHADRVRIKLCALTIVDGKDNRLFKTEADERALAGKSAKGLECVYTASSRLSGLAAKEVEEEGKGSGDSPDAAASSASPST